jgi:hypothetical protein
MLPLTIILVLLDVAILGAILMSHKHDHGCDCCKENRVLLDIIERLTKIVAHLTGQGGTLPSNGVITQISGGTNMLPRAAGSNSIPVGGSGVFQVTPTPAGTSVPAADQITFATNDPGAVVSAGPTSDPTTCTVTVAASDTNTSFVLACQFSGPDFPTPVNCTPLTVAIVPVTPPPNLPTGGSIAQIA